MTTIPFCKMSGAGNDFIIIDNRRPIVPEASIRQFVSNLCRRKMSVGADGVILLEPSDTVDFKWRFFNSDGSDAEMCGNGARCAARFALLHDMAGASMRFETLAGIIEAQVLEDGVIVKMTPPHGLERDVAIALSGGQLKCDCINTGVPHAVIAVDDIEAVDVRKTGREIRFHEHFAPAGTNVNFVACQPDGVWAARTYERGVEDETLACGTGMAAVALVLAAQDDVQSPVRIKTRSGSILKIHFERQADGFSNVHLEGDARIVYAGQLNPEAWQY